LLIKQHKTNIKNYLLTGINLVFIRIFAEIKDT